MKPVNYIVLILGLCYVFMAGFVMPNASKKLAAASDNPACAGPLDLIIGGITWESVDSNFACMGSEGMRVYRKIETTEDLIYPLTYGAFLSLAIYLLALYNLKDKLRSFKLKQFWARLFAVIPLLAMLTDFGENYEIVGLIDDYGVLDGGGVGRLAVLNSLKWMFAIGSMGLLVVFGIAALIKKVRTRA